MFDILKFMRKSGQQGSRSEENIHLSDYLNACMNYFIHDKKQCGAGIKPKLLKLVQNVYSTKIISN